MLDCIVNPSFQLFTGKCGACWVIGVAQVYYVNLPLWQCRVEVILGSTWEVCDIAPLPIGHHVACAAAHHIAVDINWIYGVGHAEVAVAVQYFTNVAGVALCPVAHEYLIGCNLHAARLEIVFHDGLAQEVIALFRAVAMERLGASEVIDGAMHGLDARCGQWACHVAYP